MTHEDYYAAALSIIDEAADATEAAELDEMRACTLHGDECQCCPYLDRCPQTEDAYMSCACGRVYSRTEYLALERPVTCPSGETMSHDGRRQTWRDCTCGSTHLVEVAR